MERSNLCRSAAVAALLGAAVQGPETLSAAEAGQPGNLNPQARYSAVEPRAGATLGDARRSAPAPVGEPDLRILGFEFDGFDEKVLRVVVANTGTARAWATRLRLTLRRTNGAEVRRTLEVQVPPLSGRSKMRVKVDARSILPRATALADTVFHLDVDAGRVLAEGDEENNRLWHRL